MSPGEAVTRLPPDALAKALRPHLFPAGRAEGSRTYAILDGASVPGLLERLAEDAPEFACLYRGELAPDMARVAPYLVRLEPDAPFTDWVLAEGWGRHWGVFVLSFAELAGLQRHFRRFLIVKDPMGRQIYFRYYDPRVLRVYLPTCNAEELKFLFGPVEGFALEDEDASVVLRFSREGEALRIERSPLAGSE